MTHAHPPLLLERATDWTGHTLSDRLLLSVDSLRAHGYLTACDWKRLRNRVQRDTETARENRADHKEPAVPNPATITVAEAIQLVEARLTEAERAAGTYSDDPANWHRRHHAAIATAAREIEDATGGKITDRHDAARVRILKISASSTGGIAAALRNWLAAARKKEAAA